MKKFPKGRIFAAALMFLCTFAMLIAFKSAGQKERTASPAFAPLSSDDDTPIVRTSLSPVVSSGYAIKIYEDTLCVFSHDGRLLLRTDIDPSKLRAVDREALKEGIFVSGSEQVWQLLEDFGS